MSKCETLNYPIIQKISDWILLLKRLSCQYESKIRRLSYPIYPLEHWGDLCVLMSTLNCEKDSLLGQSVLVKRPLLSLDMKTKVIQHVESD